MKQTAIQQLIEKIDFCILYYQNEISLNYHAPTIVEIMQGKISELERVKDMTNRMLPIEKQQIIDAYDQCGTDDTEFSNLSYTFENSKMTDAEYIEKNAKCSRNGEDYYQNTYKK